MKVKLKSQAVMLIVITFCFTLITGCGAKKPESAMSPELTVQKQSVADSSGFGSTGSENNSLKNKNQPAANMVDRKIIKSATLELETLEFDQSVNIITAKVQSIGGYIESSNIQGRRIENEGLIQNRYASITLRIPKQSFEAFMLEVGSLGNVISKNTSGQDVTGEYFDTEAHLKSLKIQEERLLEILKKTGQLKDIIELERELSNVRYQIENLTGTLKKWDNLIDYSTIRLDLREVQEVQSLKEKPGSLGEQITYGFKKSIEILIKTVKQLIVFLATALPFIFIIVIFYLVFRKVFKKNIGFLKRDKNDEQ